MKVPQNHDKVDSPILIPLVDDKELKDNTSNGNETSRTLSSICNLLQSAGSADSPIPLRTINARRIILVAVTKLVVRVGAALWPFQCVN